ncbi:MAG TPA: hypothetical protein VJ801_01035 [Polyangia bacterium]|nr:hypothetical protein [Polyangia bacterium]
MEQFWKAELFERVMDMRGTYSNPPPLLEGLLDHYCPTFAQRRSSTKKREQDLGGERKPSPRFGSTAVGEQWDEEDDLELLFELPAYSTVA